MMNRSDQAPMHWTEDHTQAAVREIILELSPDVVALQELPGMVPFVETHDMMRSNPRTHSGNLATLVGHHLLEAEPTVTTVPGVAVLTTLPEQELTVANVHLAPGPGDEAAEQRLQQMESVKDASPTADLVVIGDTNTRVDEIEAFASLGLSGRQPPSPTWDSVRNQFRSGGAEFRAYFTRHLHTEGMEVNDIVVHRSPWVGAGSFHLSDHFALSGRIDRR